MFAAVINVPRRDFIWFRFGTAAEEEARQTSEASASKAVVLISKQIGN